MIKNLDELVIKRDELASRISDPALLSQPKEWQKAVKEHDELSMIVDPYLEYKKLREGIEELKALFESEKDPDFAKSIKDEISDDETRLSALENEIMQRLLPKDPNDDKNVFLEIRAGVGGDEAALFAGDVFRMYSRYAERRGFSCSVVSANESDLGGFKELVCQISGKGAYSRLKFESGVHRVQRIPQTETGGRIHTSTITVAVLCEADDIEVKIDPNDIRIDVFRATGNGGQCVNTTDSAVRLTHYPTGIVISCQDEKSQLKNRDKAMRVLKAKLLELEKQKAHDKEASERKNQVGTGDRSEKIRTYNFPQSRVTDHRIHFTTHRIDDIMDGALDEIIDAVIAENNAERMRSSEN